MAIVKSIFLIIIFSNQIFAKDFDDLFKITIEIKDESIDKSIDDAFNNLVFRLIGYEDFEKAKTVNENNIHSKMNMMMCSSISNNSNKITTLSPLCTSYYNSKACMFIHVSI